MGPRAGIRVHDVRGGQYLHESSPVRVAERGEQVQAAEGGRDGIGDGELRLDRVSVLAETGVR